MTTTRGCGELARIKWNEDGRRAFRETYLRRRLPVVVQGAMVNWPALRLWDAEELQRRGAGTEVVVASAGIEEVSSPGNEQRRKISRDFGQFVADKVVKRTDCYMKQIELKELHSKVFAKCEMK